MELEMTNGGSAPDQIEVGVEPSEHVDGDSSLRARISERRRVLQSQRTTTIDVPGYEGILAAEYHVLPWQTIRRNVTRHERQRDDGLRELYIAADGLLMACENIYEIKPDDNRVALNIVWGLAAAQKLGIELPANATARQALLAIFGVDSRIVGHYSELVAWQQGENQELDEELARDFTTTT
jgi:hypothetical protein